MKKLSKLIVLSLLLIVSFSSRSLAAIGIEDQVSAYIVGDSATGQVFASHNSEEAVPIASLTKLMTFMIVEDAIASGEIKADEEVTITAGDIILSRPGEQHGMKNTGTERFVCLSFAGPMPMDYIPM